jgi:ATP-binding cassette, subfamily B, bacterial
VSAASRSTRAERRAERALNPTRSLLRGVREAAAFAPSLTRGFWLTALLATLGAMGALIVPLLVQQLVDGQLVAGERADMAGATRLALAAAGTATVTALSSWRAMFRLVRASAAGLTELRARVFAHLHRLPTVTVAGERRGALVARVTSDVESVTQFMEWGGIAVLIGTSQLTVVAVLMLALDPLLAAVVLAAAGVYATALLGFQRLLARRYDRVRVHVAASLGAIGEVISGLPTIRATGTEARAVAQVDASLARQFHAESRVRMLGASLFSTAELFAASTTALVVVVGMRTAGTTGITAGQLVAFLLLVTLFVAPVQVLVEVIDQAQSAAAGIRRMLDVLDLPIAHEPSAPVAPTAGPLDLVVAGLTYAYPEGPPVLRGVDVVVPAGQRVAIVGRTGSGKSTFAKVVTRLQEPPAGTVRLGGVALEDVATSELRRRVAFVPQEPFLLDASVADNVRYGDPHADDARIATAFAALELDGWLASLPDGAATRAGEGGSALSAGERQLVALVRAWLRQPDLLVLDEATSSVDPALDVRLRRAVERMTDGRTSLTVAHRLATAETADRVLVFSDGLLVEDGTHAELLALDGVYARLHGRWSVDTARS